MAQSASKRDFSFVKICFLKQDWATRSWSHTRALQVGWRKGDNLEVRRNLLDLELRLPHRYHLMLKPVDLFCCIASKKSGMTTNVLFFSSCPPSYVWKWRLRQRSYGHRVNADRIRATIWFANPALVNGLEEIGWSKISWDGLVNWVVLRYVFNVSTGQRGWLEPSSNKSGGMTAGESLLSENSC